MTLDLIFLNPQVQRMRQVCCIFSGYHAAHRAAQRDSSMHLIRTLQSRHRRHMWSVFVDACVAEARKFSIATRSFSLLQFIVFLIGDT